MQFYLGMHDVHRLWDGTMSTPLFVSYHRLQKRKKLKPAKVDWALDSGGFTHIKTHGKWTLSPDEYIENIRRFQREIGRLQFASIQDWMCEPEQVEKTGLTVREHQRLTVESFIELSSKAPDIPWIPVLQGFAIHEYIEHFLMYLVRGIDLRNFPIVGVGSVCRRQSMGEAALLIRMLFDLGLHNLHGFGFKTTGLEAVGHLFASADSLSWSFAARRRKLLLDECRDDPSVNHATCQNCPRWANQWHQEMLEKIASSTRSVAMGLPFLPFETNVLKKTILHWDSVREEEGVPFDRHYDLSDLDNAYDWLQFGAHSEMSQKVLFPMGAMLQRWASSPAYDMQLLKSIQNYPLSRQQRSNESHVPAAIRQQT